MASGQATGMDRGDLPRFGEFEVLRGAGGGSVPRTIGDLLSWRDSGFHVDHCPKPVAPHGIAGRKHLAE